jgi:hypothetical protein
MTTQTTSKPRLSRRLFGAASALAALVGGCATGGAYYYLDGDVYGGYYCNDPWYWGGCCAGPPSGIGRG